MNFTERYQCSKCDNISEIKLLTTTVNNVKCLNIVNNKPCNGKMYYIGNKRID